MKAKNLMAVFLFWLFFVGGIALFVLPIPVQKCFAQEFKLSEILAAKYTESSIGNAENLLQGIAGRKDVKALFYDLPGAQQYLLRWLKALPHAYVQLPCGVSQEPESILGFSLPQLIRVKLVLESLQNGDLSQQIGKIIADHNPNDYYEPGGLVNLKNGKIVLALRPSRQIKRVPKAEAVYAISWEDFKMPHIFQFHFHLLGASGPAPGPSYEIKFSDDGPHISFDIGAALEKAKLQGEHHHILISQLDGRKFNIDYYGAEDTDEIHDKLSLCGKLKNFKIVDLGIWNY